MKNRRQNCFLILMLYDILLEKSRKVDVMQNVHAALLHTMQVNVDYELYSSKYSKQS